MRKDLDEQIHQFLMEVAIKLTNTQEDIADLQLAARVDEVPFEDFQKKVYVLRELRDHLERQQLNLRGWLATVGPSAVGGYRDVTIDALPKDGYTLERATKPKSNDTLLNSHALGLKEAFAKRSEAKKKIEEIKKLRKTSDPEARARMKDPYAHAKASLAIAEMHIGYFQHRLQLLIQDHTGDIETLNAQVATARDKLSMDQLERSEYDSIKEKARHTKTDLEKSCEVARRLLLAKSTHEVTLPKGTHLKRVAKKDTPKKKGGSTATPMLLLGAMILWSISIVLPVTGDGSLLKAFLNFRDMESVAGIILALPVLAAAFSCLLMLIPNRALQALGALVLWGVSLVLMVYCANEAQYSLGPLADRFRTGSAWMFRPGIVVMWLACFMLLVHAVVILKKYPLLKPWVMVCVVSTVLLSGWFCTNGLGMYQAKPLFSVDVESKRAVVTAKFTIKNEGSRVAYVVEEAVTARNAYSFTLVNSDGGAVKTVSLEDVYATMPGEVTTVLLDLPPDEYRLSLTPTGDREIWKQYFIIPDTTRRGAPEPPAARQTPTVAPTETPTPMTVEPATTDTELPDEEDVDAPIEPPLPTVQLKGTVGDQDGGYKFSLEIIMEPSEPGITHTARLKEELLNAWVIDSYNPRGLLTLRRDNDTLVIKRGQRVPLPAIVSEPIEE